MTYLKVLPQNSLRYKGKLYKKLKLHDLFEDTIPAFVWKSRKTVNSLKRRGYLKILTKHSTEHQGNVLK